MERFEYERHSPVALSSSSRRHKEEVLELGEKSEKTSQFQNLSIKVIVALHSPQSDANVREGHLHQLRIHTLVL